MSPHPFLSPEWIEAVAEIRDEYRDALSAPDLAVKANVTVTDAPFENPRIEGHIDTSGGAVLLEVGHLDDSDFAIELPYDAAHQIFVDRDPQAMLGILLGGQVKLTGDSSKILGLAGLATPADEDASPSVSVAREVIARIDAVTE